MSTQSYLQRLQRNGFKNLDQDQIAIGQICLLIEQGRYIRASDMCDQVKSQMSAALKAVCESEKEFPVAPAALELVRTIYGTYARSPSYAHDIDTVSFFARALVNIGEAKEAVALYGAACEKNASEDAWVEAAAFYIRQSDWPRALHACERLIPLDPESTQYSWWYLTVGVVLLQDMDPLESIEDKALLLQALKRELEELRRVHSLKEITRASEKSYIALRILSLEAAFRDATKRDLLVNVDAEEKNAENPENTQESEPLTLHGFLQDPQLAEYSITDLGLKLYLRDLTVKYGSAEQRNALYNSLLETMTSDMNWHAWKTAVDLASELRKEKELVDFISAASYDKAQIEQCRRLAEMLLLEKLGMTSRVVAAALDYIDLFGAAPSVSNMLKPIVVRNAEDMRGPLLEKHTLGETRDDAQKYLTRAALLRYIEGPDNTGQAADSLLRLDAKEGDLHLVDEAVLVAAQSLVQENKHIHAIALLDSSVRRSKANYALRLLLVNELDRLGADTLAHAQFAKLQVKEVQQETLSHVLVSNLASSAYYDRSVDFATQTVAWYVAHGTEGAYSTVQALSEEAYERAEDFGKFASRIARSLNKAISCAQVLRANVIRHTDDVSLYAALLKQELRPHYRDNRDTRTLANVSTGEPYFEVPGLEWLSLVLGAYHDVLNPVGMEFPAITTSVESAERDLYELGRALNAFCVSSLGEAPDEASAEAVGGFFKTQLSHVLGLMRSGAAYGLVKSRAMLLVEAMCLVDRVLDKYLVHMALTKNKGRPRFFKQARTLKTRCKDALKPLGAKLSQHGKGIAKDMAKYAGLAEDPLFSMYGVEAHDVAVTLAGIQLSLRVAFEGVSSLLTARLHDIH